MIRLKKSSLLVLFFTCLSISFSGCAGGRGGRDLPGGGGAGTPGANLGADDVAAIEIWFETNGQRDSNPTVGVPGDLVLDVINSFSGEVTVHVQWSENNAVLFQDNYVIPVGESTIRGSWMFNVEGERTVMATVRLVDPPVAEEPANNEVHAQIWAQAARGPAPQTQGVDMSWADFAMTDAAGAPVVNPVEGQPVNIYSVSVNLGDTAAQNVRRALTIEGNQVGGDSLGQSEPGRPAPFSVRNYAFPHAGNYALRFEMSDFTPPQSPNGRGINPGPVTVRVLPAGANPPGGGGGVPEGADMHWRALTMKNEAGQEIREPIVGQRLQLLIESANTGVATARNFTRALSIDGGSAVHSDTVTQCDPRQAIPFPANHTFQSPGVHRLIYTMSGANIGNDLTVSIPVTVHPLARITPPSQPPTTLTPVPITHELSAEEIFYVYDDSIYLPDQDSIDQDRAGHILGYFWNQSSVDEPEVEVDLKVNGHRAGPDPVRIRNAERNRVIQFNIPYHFPEPGSYLISYDLDPDRRITESDEGNNHMERLINVQNPRSHGTRSDLRCLNIQFKEYASTPPMAIMARGVTETSVGTPGVLSGTFYNQNDGPVERVYVKILVDGVQIGTTDVFELFRGELGRVEKNNYSFPSGGTHKIRMEISGPAGFQDDASNNHIERKILVHGPIPILPAVHPAQPDLTITPPGGTGTPSGPACDLEPTIPTMWTHTERHSGNLAYTGESGELVYRLKNHGTADIPGVKVDVKVIKRLTGEEMMHLTRTVTAIADQSGRSRQAQQRAEEENEDRMELPASCFTEATTYDMFVEADPAPYHLNDTDRTNNLSPHGFTVRRRSSSPPQDRRMPYNPNVAEQDCDLVAQDVTFRLPDSSRPVTSIAAGQRGTVHYTVKNKSRNSAETVYSEVQFILNGQVMQVVPGGGLNVPAKGSKSGKSDVAPFTVPGTYKMVLTVDPLNRKKDDRRGDNVLTRSLQVIARRQPTAVTSQESQGQSSVPAKTLLSGFTNILDSALSGQGTKGSSSTGSSGSSSTTTVPSASTVVKKTPVLTAKKIGS